MSDSFLWRKVSEKEKEEIKKEAKRIMDSFHKALSKVEKKVSEARVEREECERVEGEGEEASKEFREIMLKNAPETDNGFIKAEKGEWRGR